MKKNQNAEPIPGPTIDRLARITKKFKILIIKKKIRKNMPGLSHKRQDLFAF